MLNQKAWNCVKRIMSVGSFMKFVPYQWDKKYNRFLKAPLWHLVIFYFHFATALSMGLFSAVRLGLALAKREKIAVPNRIKTMTTLWALVYSLEIVCFIQFHFKMDQIRFYANSLFAYVETDRKMEDEADAAELESRRNSRTRDALQQQEINEAMNNMNSAEVGSLSSNIKKPRDWISIFVQVSTFMLIVNPPSHSIMLSDNPCAPHFLSSIFLVCEATDDKSQPFLQKLPFVLIENFTITTVFYVLTFNWTMIFLGLAWIKQELTKSKIDRQLHENDKIMAAMEHVPTNYRYIQMVSTLMNDCFRLYLEWFPSILLGIVAFLAFAVIRFYYLDFRSYMMFPSCGLRCIFETFTPLTLAGYVNNECASVLKQWKTEISIVQLSNQDDTRWIRRFQKSCAFIKCSAGSLYAFENAIVLVTICNCTLLTCNLLIMFKGSN